MVKLAYLETLRHSPPVLAAPRYARHEVERFGRLLPEGALVICSAAAANRDPRAFPNDPTPSSYSARTCASASRAGSTGPTACPRASRSGSGSRRSTRRSPRTDPGRCMP